jgi:peptidoglycan/LPS O-acetylase OafA/YrhL
MPRDRAPQTRPRTGTAPAERGAAGAGRGQAQARRTARPQASSRPQASRRAPLAASSRPRRAPEEAARQGRAPRGAATLQAAGRRAAEQPRDRRRNDALDGLRALAIASVVLYHLSVGWLPSGHMGVIVFLVLTGYLLTSSLVRTLVRGGAIGYRALWARRLRRIWPPMAICVFVTVAACVLFNHVLLTKLRPDFVPSLLLVSNLAAIARGASYFDHLGGTSPLTHLWYLGLDAQFCLVWPPVLALLWKLGARRRDAALPRRATFALALASAVAMAALFDPNGDPTRVYYGPDTRLFAPLVGAWLALLWPLGRRRPVGALGGSTLDLGSLDIFGVVGLVGVVAVMVLSADTATFLYRGGMMIVALLSAALVASLLDPATLTSRLFSARPLVWLGRRSFGIYLWHFPLFQLLRVNNGDTPAWVVALAVVASVALAELSLRFVEEPLARGGLPRPAAPGRLAPAQAAALLAGAAVVAVAVVGAVVVPDETALPADALNNTGVSAGEAKDLTSEAQQAAGGGDDGGSADGSASVAEGATPDDHLVLTASADEAGQNLHDPFVIADSVAGDASWYFDQHCPNGYLDSYVGRRPDQALDVLKGYVDQGVVGKVVVLCTFSNSPATTSTLDQLVQTCGDRIVYVVNVSIPESEEAQINSSLTALDEKYDNVHLIDWNSYVADHGADSAEPWLYADKEHLTPQGQPHYIDLITSAIAKDFVESAGGSAQVGTVGQNTGE